MRHSENTKEIFEALAKAQGAFGGAKKDSLNPHFKSKYADLASIIEAVRPAMTANGLSSLQEVTMVERGVAVTTLVTHSSGQWVEFGPIVVPLQKTDAHGVGSASTYARRYALGAALGVAAEDDDGNEALKPAPQMKQAVRREMPEEAKKALELVEFSPEEPYVIPSGPNKGKRLNEVDSEVLGKLNKYYEDKQAQAKSENKPKVAEMHAFVLAQIQKEVTKREEANTNAGA